MKKNLILSLGIALLLNPIYSEAQSLLHESIRNTQYSTLELQMPLFEKREDNGTYQNRFENAQYVKLNKAQLQNLLASDKINSEIALLYNNKTIHFTVKQYDVLSPHFKAYEKYSDGTLKAITYDKGQFYRGVMEDQNSLIAFTVHNGILGGVFSIAGEGNFNIVLDYNNPGINNDNYIIFNEKDIITNETRPHCEFDDNYKNQIAGDQQAAMISTSTCKSVDVALYADYLSYQKNNNNTQSTLAYLTTIFNANATLFLNENINISISRMIVNSQPDGYPTATSNAILNKFGLEIGTNTTGDLMQFVSGYTQGGNYAPLGGLAWLDALCDVPRLINNDETYFGPFSMINTAALNNLPNMPIYTWDVSASNHEMGHNLGSPHTQSCAWNGNNTTIDGCVAAEGNCATGPIPPRGAGTMMSYCHLNNAVGVDFSNGYGPQPGDLIRNRYSGATCLSTSIIPNEIVNTASYTSTADRICEDNGWYYLYNTKNDADNANDELVLMVEKTASISAMDISQINASIRTNQQWSTGVSRNIGNTSYSYYNDQKAMNKEFRINLPGTLTGQLKVRMPFNQSDFTDLGNSFNVTTPEPFRAMIYTTSNVYTSPNNADTAAIKSLPHTLVVNAPNTWRMVYSNPAYYIAEFRMNSSYYAGTLIYGNNPKYNTSVDQLEQLGITLYPNPANDLINISNPTDKMISVRMLNALGQTVYVGSSNKTLEIQTSKLATGVYTIQIQHEKGNATKKIVVSH